MTLRGDRAAIRSDLEARFGALRSGIDKLRADLHVRFARLEAKIHEKPGAAVIRQASLATFAGMLGVAVGTAVLLKTPAFIA